MKRITNSILLTVIAGLLSTPLLAQNRDEIRITVKGYIEGLDGSFASRCIDNELVLIDWLTAAKEEYKFRKGQKKSVPNDNSLGAFARKEFRDSIRQSFLSKLADLTSMKKKNQLLPGYPDQKSLTDLHLQYQKLYSMDFNLTKRDVRALHAKILKSGDDADTRRFFERDMKNAFRRYKQGSYLAAAAELRELYTDYQSYFTEWDDILYFTGDSYFRNKAFDDAETFLYKVVSDFPQSKYVERALFTLVTMSYITDDRVKMQKYFTEFESKVTARPKDDNTYNRAFFLAGTTYFVTTDYGAGISVLGKIPLSSQYYYPAKYLLAHCYAAQDDYTSALEQFNSVMKLTPNNKRFGIDQQRQLKDLSILKSAFVKFEQTVNGQKGAATDAYLNKLSENSDVFDAGLLVKAWAAFKDNHIDTARIYADSLIRNYSASDHVFEAKTLVGNIQILDPKFTDAERERYALEAFNFVADATQDKYVLDQFLAQRSAFKSTLEAVNSARTASQLRNDELGYAKQNRAFKVLSEIYDHESTKSRNLKYYHAVAKLASKTKETEGLLNDAQSQNDATAVLRIQEQLADQITQFGDLGAGNYADLGDSTQANASEEKVKTNRVSRTLSEIESRNKTMSALKEKITGEKQIVVTQLTYIDQLIQTAKERDNQSAQLKLEFEKNKLTSLFYRLSDFEVILAADAPIESYVDLDTWGDFANYGRNNINYVLNTTKSETISDISKAVAQIDKILLGRKKNYENRIVQIEEEVKRKEQEIRDKELQEMRSSQKQFFEKEYFQFKKSEKPENDPFDYNDVTPEIIVIVQDTIPAEKEEEAKTDEEEPAQDPGASADSNGTQQKDLKEGAASDSVKTDGGGGGQKEIGQVIFSPKSDVFYSKGYTVGLTGYTRRKFYN